MTELQFMSAGGAGKKLALHEPQGKPKAIVQVAHGMAEYYARYYPLAEALAAAGCVAAGYDHLGHGPDTPRDGLGYFADSDGWQKVVDDMRTAHDLLRARYPGCPFILLGHSMGSFLAREYLLQYGEGLDALVISGTGWMPAALVNTLVFLASAICAFGGKKKPSALLHRLSFDANNKSFRPNRTGFDWGSSDNEQVDLYVNDPLCGFMFTAGGMRDLGRGLQQLGRLDRLSGIRNKDLPILFISGEKDPVGGRMAEGPKTVAAQYKRAGLRNITMQLYPEGRHEMFNEVNREEVRANLIRWIDGLNLQYK